MLRRSGWQRLRSPRFLAVLVLLVDLGLTLLAWQYASRQTEKELHDYFQFRVREARTLLEQRLLVQEQVLRGAQGLFVGSDQVSRQDFRHYVSALQLEEFYPGIQGLAYLQLINSSSLSSHVQQVRADAGQPAYLVWPEGQRSQYSSVIYIEPFAGRNLRMLGWDMLTEPVARQAMELARDSGQAVTSARLDFELPGERVSAPSFLMLLPIYQRGAAHGTLSERQQHIAGWVFSPFRMQEFAHGLFGEQAADLDIEIYDGENMSPDTLLYDSHPSESRQQGGYPLWQVEKVKQGQHVWSLVIHARSGLLNRVNEGYAHWVLVIGGLASLLFSALTWLLFSGRDRAEAYAHGKNLELILKAHALHESEAKLKAVLNASEVAIVWGTADGRLEYVNTKFILLFGYALDEVPTLEHWFKRGFPNVEYRNKLASQWQQALNAALPLKTPIAPMEMSVFCRDGQTREVLMMASWADDRLLLTFSDITWRKHAEADLRKLSTAVEQNPAMVVITDLQARIEYVNPRFTEVTGYNAAEVLGQNPRVMQSGQTPAEVYRQMWTMLHQGLSWSGEFLNRRKNGELYWEEIRVAPVKDTLGQISHYVAIKNDITERKQHDQLIKQLAHYDTLTGLPNRALFGDRLKQALTAARREGQQLALMFIDLDKFKPINDMYGHHVGDLVLSEVAQRMLSCVRESDTVARLGGDEFVVVLLNVVSKPSVLQVAEKIRLLLNEPITLQEQRLSVGASIGIAVYPEHGIVEADLIHSADVAMYHAKQMGRNCVVVYRNSLELG